MRIFVPLAISTFLATITAAADSPQDFFIDDECDRDANGEDSQCAFQALQLRSARRSSESETNMPDVIDMEDVFVRDDLPEGWNASDYGVDPEGTLSPAVSTDMGTMSEGVDCRLQPFAQTCALYRLCQFRAYCVLGGYMVVPGFYAEGMESINGGNAGRFEFLMSAAHSRCSDSHCVLITNPMCCRTQEQLHIHYRHYNGGGASLKRQLEHKLCGTHGWQYFHKCGSGKARIFNSFPNVFSEVARAYGGGNLGHVGITVWQTSACGGGSKTMVLATTHCSIEHSISKR